MVTKLTLVCSAVLAVGAVHGARLSFGGPVPLPHGGKMSNTLDLYPAGVASNGQSSVDGGRSYQKLQFNLSRYDAWTSFASYTDPTTKARWAHSFGAPGEVLVPAPNATSFGSTNGTHSFQFKAGQLVRTAGPNVSFSGLPASPCGPWTPYASGHVQLPSGLHLQTGMWRTCSPASNNIGIFGSKDGYEYEFIAYVARSADVPSSSEGPNEHDLALLPDGRLLVVFRTGAGDGRGQYEPYMRTVSSDGGKTWSKPQPIMDTDGHYAGCARPHLLQLGSNTLLSGGRMMMGRDYSRSFSIWLSQDSGLTWQRFDGSYQHNLNAHLTHAPLWPADCNRTGWRFQYTSGYVGLVRVGEASAAVLYDLMIAPPEEKLGHNPAFSFSMRIDVVP